MESRVDPMMAMPKFRKRLLFINLPSDSKLFIGSESLKVSRVAGLPIHPEKGVWTVGFSSHGGHNQHHVQRTQRHGPPLPQQQQPDKKEEELFKMRLW